MSHSDIVLDFINGWNQLDWDRVESLLAPDVLYHNIPMEPINGRAAAMGFIRGMDAKAVNWEVLSIAENGDKVLTERIDNFDLANGIHLSVPVMGTFEISDGLITAWRDYFDLATFTSQMAG